MKTPSPTVLLVLAALGIPLVVWAASRTGGVAPEAPERELVGVTRAGSPEEEASLGDPDTHLAAPEPSAVEAQPEEPAGASAEDQAAREAAEREAALAAMRERRDAERARLLAERDRHMEEWARQRSKLYADQLGLPPGAEGRIADLLFETDQRMAEARREAFERRSNREGHERLKEKAEEVKAWRNAAFHSAFGFDLATDILGLVDGPLVLGTVTAPDGSTSTEITGEDWSP